MSEADASREAPDWRAAVFARRGALLALPAVVLAVFGRPSSRSAVFGLPLAIAGEAIRCWAVGYSGVTTRGDRVTAPELVTAGPYAYVRNPLYAGNFGTAAGFTIAFTGANSARSRALLAFFGLGTMLAVYAAIVPHEEQFLRTRFGSAFDDYAARVHPIVPSIGRGGEGNGSYNGSVILKAETRTFATFGAMLGVLAFKLARGSD